jgi:hypothetical protein
MSHVDGSTVCPSPELRSGNKNSQRAIIILHASLSEEAFSEVIGLTNAREIWVALEAAYSNSSLERVQNLRDQLRQLTKGSSRR